MKPLAAPSLALLSIAVLAGHGSNDTAESAVTDASSVVSSAAAMPSTEASMESSASASASESSDSAVESVVPAGDDKGFSLITVSSATTEGNKAVVDAITQPVTDAE
ncbi:MULTISPECIES: hypothetical protein [unclassified Rothia (in: high G+C Gram-positive bacteria)]|uniref:hypothetical protein n=1 Tax=unclassified Rothia (in: high G+C Gram-positive bacteria) TaxID=2689056 RepID=UPI00195EC3DD|nr:MULTISPECIES: hypothetical protein [unclassified Rothia (in: high G+C Gram-positive bacteria)]MBM7051128.1 hypothetical protein [Rothia sp. ZJ1223]QRZ62172.1 hypothetical protein JR346_03390 [Rothia sp. ZJ932]